LSAGGEKGFADTVEVAPVVPLWNVLSQVMGGEETAVREAGDSGGDVSLAEAGDSVGRR
jgi:hypothetical protein